MITCLPPELLSRIFQSGDEFEPEEVARPVDFDDHAGAENMPPLPPEIQEVPRTGIVSMRKC